VDLDFSADASLVRRPCHSLNSLHYLRPETLGRGAV
jgi:hypothetical protein